MGQFHREPWGHAHGPPARPRQTPRSPWASSSPQAANPLEEDAGRRLCRWCCTPHRASLASDAAQGSVLRLRPGQLVAAGCPRPVCVSRSRSLGTVSPGRRVPRVQRPHGALRAPPSKSPGADWSGQQVLFSGDPPTATVLVRCLSSQHLRNPGLPSRFPPKSPGQRL